MYLISIQCQKLLQGETISIMFVDDAEAPSTNIMDMVSPYAPGSALWKYNVPTMHPLLVLLPPESLRELLPARLRATAVVLGRQRLTLSM